MSNDNVYNPHRLMTLQDISSLVGLDPVIIKRHLRSGKLVDQTEQNVREYMYELEMSKERLSSRDRYENREQTRHHKWKIEDEIALQKLKNEEYIEFVGKKSEDKNETNETTLAMENKDGKLP